MGYEKHSLFVFFKSTIEGIKRNIYPSSSFFEMGGGGSKTNSPTILEKSSVKQEDNINTYPALIEFIFNSNDGISWWNVFIIISCTVAAIWVFNKLYKMYKSKKKIGQQDPGVSELKESRVDMENVIKTSINPLIDQLNEKATEGKKEEEFNEALKKNNAQVENTIKTTLSPILMQFSEREAEGKQKEDLKQVVKSTLEPVIQEIKMFQPKPFYYPNPGRLQYSTDRFTEISETVPNTAPSPPAQPPPAPVAMAQMGHPPQVRGNGRRR